MVCPWIFLNLLSFFSPYRFQGVELNPRDREKCTPLLLAAAHGCPAVVSYLLESGADVTCEDDKKRTALHWAVGQDKTIERLLKVKFYALASELARSYLDSVLPNVRAIYTSVGPIILRIRRSRKQRDSSAGHWLDTKLSFCSITDKHSNKSWNWFVKSSIPGALSPPLLKTFAAVFPDPIDGQWRWR